MSNTSYRIPLWLAIVVLLGVALLVSACLIAVMQVVDATRDREMRKLIDEAVDNASQLREKDRDLQNLKSRLHDEEVPGIPNFRAWEFDLQNWASEQRRGKQHSLILVDLENLKWLNGCNRDCADEVLRFFAGNPYSAMRRDEQIYKVHEVHRRPLLEAGEPTMEMYRHYQGGDEFFFTITGDVYSAVGHLKSPDSPLRVCEEIGTALRRAQGER